MSYCSSSRKLKKGSAMVESSLVLVVFLTLLIGIADLGQILFIHASIVERLREGLRYGVITYDPTAIRNIVLYGTDRPTEGAVPGFNLASNMVDVSRFDANTPEDRIRIAVSNYPVEFFAPFIARRFTGKAIVAVQAMELGNLP